jgi:hypothetical protein
MAPSHPVTKNREQEEEWGDITDLGGQYDRIIQLFIFAKIGFTHIS